MTTKSKKYQLLNRRNNPNEILGLNEDREGAFWQEERGPRYGCSRKAIAKKKRYERKRKLRLKEKNDE
jgi:hypothetical protein